MDHFWLIWILIPISPFQNITLINESENKDIKFTIAYYYFPLRQNHMHIFIKSREKSMLNLFPCFCFPKLGLYPKNQISILIDLATK
ncbi:hypothetical protein VIGAN_08115400 [Vigna angularis var. angularis]|uniref:Uncharacterized protein n=1 Tax=Vigna angularis var. angularis TaxID=157739 RepID=A0A0S3SNY3_PHAAN|nr:hypothetical protein VIGAN_08115400 [Vigna angularis var. angularis]